MAAESLSWRRMARWAALVAFVVTVALAAPFMRDHWQARQQELAAAPHPVVATDVELTAILRAVLDSPSGEPGQSVRRRDEESPGLLFDRTVRLRPCRKTPPAPGTFAHCEEEDPAAWHGDAILDNVFETRDFPIKLRQELVSANAQVDSTAGVALAGVHRIDARYPMGLGTRPSGVRHALATSRAVLTADRATALVYVEHQCNDLCARGVLVLLSRTTHGWRVIRALEIWTE